MRDYPRISRGVQCHHKSPCKSQRRRCDDRNRDQRETEREISGWGRCYAVGLEDGEGATSQGTWAPLETGKCKETDSPIEPPKGKQPADTLILAQ